MSEARRMAVAEALAEVFPAKADTDTTVHLTVEDRERLLAALDDFGTTERAAALDLLVEMIQKAERDAALLEGREHDPTRFNEALRLIALLKAGNGCAACMRVTEAGGRCAECGAMWEPDALGTLQRVSPDGCRCDGMESARFLLRAADRLAAAIAHRITLGHLDARSEAGDALLDYDSLNDHRAAVGIEPREGRIGV